jgi:galactoside O-acetyltransferase
VLIGSGSVVLPGVTIGEGSAVGALSLVSMSLDEWGVYFGSPAKRIKARSKNLLEMEKLLREGG